MNRGVREAIKRELATRGFRYADGGRITAPNDSVWFDDDFLDATGLGDLLDLLVARREKIFGSSAVVGPEIAKRNFEDAAAAVEAVKAIVNQLGSSPV